MSVKITGLKDIQANMKKIEKKLNSETRKAIRKSLNAGAKELKNAIKPHIPVIGSSTNFRQKGTVKNNLRHRTKIAKDGKSGLTVIRIRRAGKKRMARVGENVRDRKEKALNTVRNTFYQEMKGMIK